MPRATDIYRTGYRLGMVDQFPSGGELKADAEAGHSAAPPPPKPTVSAAVTGTLCQTTPGVSNSAPIRRRLWTQHSDRPQAEASGAAVNAH